MHYEVMVPDKSGEIVPLRLDHINLATPDKGPGLVRLDLITGHAVTVDLTKVDSLEVRQVDG